MAEDHAYKGVGECHPCREFEGMQPSRYMNTSLASATGVSPWVSTDLVQIKDVRIELAPTHSSIATCSGYWGARNAARKPASLKLSEFVVGCIWCMCVRVGRDKAPCSHEFDTATGRRHFVFQPVFTHYELL